MKIETVISMTHNEYIEFIKESNSRNRRELKNYLKHKFDIQTDFCVKIEENEENGAVYIALDYGE